MPLQIIRQIKNSASQMAYKSMLYNWSLRGDVPERLAVKPVDPWPGNIDAARWLIENNAFTLEGEQLALRGECWEPYGVSDAWLGHMHGFSWLRDLRALGGETARRQAQGMVASWIYHYPKWTPQIWNPGLTGARVASWISLYEFFGDSADEEFQELFFESVVRQARHLARALPGEIYGLDALNAIKGLLYAGLGFEGYEDWVHQALELLEKEIAKQILADGMHVTRSPARLLEALQIFLDIRGALQTADYPLPEKLQHAIDKMGPALRFFRMADKNFALFNGTQEGDTAMVDTVLAQAGIRGKGLQSLPCGGYERVSQGRTSLIFDCGQSPAWPYDLDVHAAPLAFEMTYGKDRLFVSCGSHPSCPEWQEALRATAAHNTLTLGYRNACEIREDGHLARKVKNSAPLREENKEAALLEASHDGYGQLYGIIHARRLYLSNKGHDLRGEDALTSTIGLSRPLDVAIRFHIHPGVLVSLIRDGEEALLRLSSGIGWRFHQSGGVLALENSIYLGQGSRPRKTKQLVIYGQISENKNKFKWALQREG